MDFESGYTLENLESYQDEIQSKIGDLTENFNYYTGGDQFQIEDFIGEAQEIREEIDWVSDEIKGLVRDGVLEKDEVSYLKRNMNNLSYELENLIKEMKIELTKAIDSVLEISNEGIIEEFFVGEEEINDEFRQIEKEIEETFRKTFVLNEKSDSIKTSEMVADMLSTIHDKIEDRVEDVEREFRDIMSSPSLPGVKGYETGKLIPHITELKQEALELIRETEDQKDLMSMDDFNKIHKEVVSLISKTQRVENTFRTNQMNLKGEVDLNKLKNNSLFRDGLEAMGLTLKHKEGRELAELLAKQPEFLTKNYLKIQITGRQIIEDISAISEIARDKTLTQEEKLERASEHINRAFNCIESREKVIKEVEDTINEYSNNSNHRKEASEIIFAYTRPGGIASRFQSEKWTNDFHRNEIKKVMSEMQAIKTIHTDLDKSHQHKKDELSL